MVWATTALVTAKSLSNRQFHKNRDDLQSQPTMKMMAMCNVCVLLITGH
jgi:hypothetical protein